MQTNTQPRCVMDDLEQPPSKRVKLAQPSITVDSAHSEPFDDVSDFWDSEPEENVVSAEQQHGQPYSSVTIGSSCH